MAIQSTGNQGLPYPDNAEYLKYVWQYIRDAELAIEKKLVQVFASQTDLTTRVPSPVEGMMAYLKDSDIIQVYNGTSWKRVYPQSPAIYSGTTAPASTLGSVGDFYMQTS